MAIFLLIPRSVVKMSDIVDGMDTQIHIIYDRLLDRQYRTTGESGELLHKKSSQQQQMLQDRRKGLGDSCTD